MPIANYEKQVVGNKKSCNTQSQWKKQIYVKQTTMNTKVYSSELKIGMFVSSLDRPWVDTPFMFQGFLIENEKDIVILQQYCEFVHVDWVRSLLQQPILSSNRPASSLALTNANNQSLSSTPQTSSAGTKPTHANQSNDVPEESELSEMFAVKRSRKAKTYIPPPETEPKNTESLEANINDYSDQEGFLARFAGKVMGFFESSSKQPQSSNSIKQLRPSLEDSAVGTERPTFIPSNIELSMYVDARPVEEEIAPAVKAHRRANDALNNLIHDIKANKQLTIEKTEEVVQEVVSSMMRNPDAMMWVARLRSQDEHAYGHGLQVAVYLVALGRHLGLPKSLLDRLCMIGLLLDIGKLKLPKDLLLKKGRLDPEEFETMKSHVQLALDILKDTPDLHPDILQGIAQHHERENGSGYPSGLSGNEISLFGRMSAIVDSFSELTDPLSHAEAMPAYEALQCLSSFNSGLYQATMIEQFIQAIGVFPVGSMVELSSGEVAVVISHSKVRRLKPRVLIISDSSKHPSPQPTTVDLLYQPQIVGAKELYIQRGLSAGAFGLDAREFYLD